MSRKDNDSLEDFFRKSTQHPDVQFNEDDWSKMEKRLDDHFGKPIVPVWRSRGRIIMLTALVATLGALTLLLWPGQGDDLNNRAEDTQTKPIPQTSIPPENTQEPLRDVDNDHADEIQPGNGKPLQDDIQTQGEDNGTISKRIPDQLAQEETTSQRGRTVPNGVTGVNDNGVEPSSQQSTTRTERLQPELSGKVPESPGFNQKQTDPKEALNEEVGRDLSGMVEEESDQPADSASAVITADALDADKTADEESKEAADKALDYGRFGISIIAAPDFSMTTGGGALGSGEAVGIMLHYQVFDRWGISAGALHNTKKYWGPGSEYHPPTGYWNALTNGLVPDRVDGSCALYEIPVAVTFDVVRTKRSRLFASAGLSSYIMQSEDYYYKFDNPNPGAVTGWSGDKPSTLWFGIGTLSVGYDFRATRSLSFGVEPYLKVPLEGIGWADIDLYSTGLMFAARYHFKKSGNKHPPPSKGP